MISDIVSAHICQISKVKSQLQSKYNGRFEHKNLFAQVKIIKLYKNCLLIRLVIKSVLSIKLSNLWRKDFILKQM